jgi:hypothetical protein
MEVDSKGHFILHDMCTQQLAALNVEVGPPLPSPNPLFLQPLVHLKINQILVQSTITKTSQATQNLI